MPDRPGLALAYSGQVANVRIKKALAAHGLKPAQGHTLILLAGNRAMSQQALLESLGVDPSVLVTILNDLEREGLVDRRRDPADRRRHIVEIQDKGVKLVDEVHRAIAAVEEALFADMDDGEVATLRRLLGCIKVAPDEAECTGEH
jgi:DNA-binding MarR family transcriptional regulator